MRLPGASCRTRLSIALPNHGNPDAVPLEKDAAACPCAEVRGNFEKEMATVMMIAVDKAGRLVWFDAIGISDGLVRCATTAQRCKVTLPLLLSRLQQADLVRLQQLT